MHKIFKRIVNKGSSIIDKVTAPILLAYRQRTKPKIVNIAGIKIPVSEYFSDKPIKAIYNNTYEKYELEILKSQLNPNDVVMELGTGLGLLSSYCAKKNGSSKVFTYEANPELESIVRHTYTLNQVEPYFKICLLGEETGEQIFYIGKDFWSSSIVQRNPQDKAITIPVYSFNQEVRKIDPTFLIIDIEGGEYDLLNYADFYNTKKIIIEIHDHVIGKEKAQFIISKLEELGFRLNSQVSFAREFFFQRE